MSNSTKYFQLTSDILVEYSYHNFNEIYSLVGDSNEYIADLGDYGASVITNGYCATRTFLSHQTDDKFVLPINKSESKFIQCINKHDILNNNFKEDIVVPLAINNNDEYDDILKDTFRLHFTGRNYFGNYDGLIITVHIYDKIKTKIGLLSQYIRRTDDSEINPNPTLINQKLYTTYQDFMIPNISGIINADKVVSLLPGEQKLRDALTPRYEIMENTPVIMSIFGVKSTFTDNNGYEYYNVEKLNSIYIPIEDKSNKLEVKVEEATDGDYFKIYPEIDNGTISFSNYINNISDGHPERYIIFYEVFLKEYIEGRESDPITTHREQYIINSIDAETSELNESELNKIMYYRPIVINGGKIIQFTIEANMHIINTLDNTTVIKKGSLDYSSQNGLNPKKYGKRMNKIYLGEIPSKVNVYNKKPDVDTDGVKIINSSSNVKIENHQHSVIGFIECANVGVSIEQVPQEWLQ